MKNITPRLVELLKEGFCTPQIVQLAKKLKEPPATVHYNVKKLETDGAIKGYKAVFDHEKIGKGYCTYLLIQLNQEKYGKHEAICNGLSEHPDVESVDVTTGDYEIIVKLRVKDQHEYYAFVQEAITKYGIAKATSLTSLKQYKSEFSQQ